MLLIVLSSHKLTISWTEIHLDLKRRMESYKSWKDISDEEGVDECALLAITHAEFEGELIAILSMISFL